MHHHRNVMQPIQEAIAGKEEQGDLSTPCQALEQFYCAFNTRDMTMISENWWRSDDISMDNPLGGIKRGLKEIGPVYERIFNGKAEVYVEYLDYTVHEADEMFYAVGRERGYFRSGGKEIALAIRTIRIFRKVDGRWKQSHHHGSIEDPRLLVAYQAAVSGKKT
jgi:ketosteroid isomerase-like protein